MAERFPSWKQALITFFGGIVLAGTTCFGFLVSLGGNLERGGNDLSSVAAIGFCISLVVILVGFVFVIMRILIAMSEKGKPTSGAPPAAGPTEPGVPS